MDGGKRLVADRWDYTGMESAIGVFMAECVDYGVQTFNSNLVKLGELCNYLYSESPVNKNTFMLIASTTIQTIISLIERNEYWLDMTKHLKHRLLGEIIRYSFDKVPNCFCNDVAACRAIVGIHKKAFCKTEDLNLIDYLELIAIVALFRSYDTKGE